MATFKNQSGDWTEYRDLPDLMTVDFHYEDEGYDVARLPYWEAMEEVWETALNALKRAYEDGNIQYVLFTHGSSTSRIGKATTRSQVRKLMRSTEATPYIDRRCCIQHYSVFVAAIRKKK